MSQPVRVAIHGFGRVGRQIFKAFWDLAPAGMEVAAIGLSQPEDAPAGAHLLKYDSNYGQWKPRVRYRDGGLEVDERRFPLVAADQLSALPDGPIVRQLTYLELNASYLINQMSNMRFTIGYAMRDLSPAPDQQNSGHLYAAFRMALFNRYADF